MMHHIIHTLVSAGVTIGLKNFIGHNLDAFTINYLGEKRA
jgi:hypothetical protein